MNIKDYLHRKEDYFNQIEVTRALKIVIRHFTPPDRGEKYPDIFDKED